MRAVCELFGGTYRDDLSGQTKMFTQSFMFGPRRGRADRADRPGPVLIFVGPRPGPARPGPWRALIAAYYWYC